MEKLPITSTNLPRFATLCWNSIISSPDLLRLWLMKLFEISWNPRNSQKSYRPFSNHSQSFSALNISHAFFRTHQPTPKIGKKHPDLLQLLTIQAQLCLQPLRAFSSLADQIFCSGKPPGRKKMSDAASPLFWGESIAKGASFLLPKKRFFRWRFVNHHNRCKKSIAGSENC